jgi:F-type H+-transporting ATPase subunit b
MSLLTPNPGLIFWMLVVFLLVVFVLSKICLETNYEWP